jgi:hypothetical protein
MCWLFVSTLYGIRLASFNSLSICLSKEECLMLLVK